MKLPPIPEKAVQNQIVHLLRSLGASVYVLGTTRPRGDSHGTRQTPGIPDLYAVLPRPVHGDCGPTPIWVEVKRLGGRLRPEQAKFREECRLAQMVHVVGGVDDVLRFLVQGGWVKAANLPWYRRPGLIESEADHVSES